MNVDLTGRTAIITGAGRGIGRAIAEKLALAGASVILNDLDDEPAQETKSLIEKNGSERVRALAGDITQAEFPEKLVNTALSEFGSIDIIVNNAGYTWDGYLHKTTDEQFLAMLDIHVVAPFRVLRAAAPWLRETAKKELKERRPVMRKVVNITSVSAVDGISGQSGYGSGKGAVIGLTKVLAKEWGAFNINVNAVAYGFIQTRLTQAVETEGTTIDVKGQSVKLGIQGALIGFMKEQTPLGRLGSTEEAAGPVMFFCSPWSDFVTGEVLVCSGGSRIRAGS
jgi:3-oxoacyl-[acyl-carrier protein] reductase